jgi:hypothetical protein
MGAVNNKLSKQSNMPPWPGINFPESLTPEPLFNTDSNKSPSWPTIDKINPREINLLKDKFNQLLKAKVIMILNKIPPTDPSRDFLGLILGYILFFPNLIPTI